MNMMKNRNKMVEKKKAKKENNQKQNGK